MHAVQNSIFERRPRYVGQWWQDQNRNRLNFVVGHEALSRCGSAYLARSRENLSSIRETEQAARCRVTGYALRLLSSDRLC